MSLRVTYYINGTGYFPKYATWKVNKPNEKECLAGLEWSAFTIYLIIVT